MAMVASPGAFPKSIARKSSRYWTGERLEEALNYVIGSRTKKGGQDEVGVHELAHHFRAGHDLVAKSGHGNCDLCGDKYAPDEKELLSALAAPRDAAEADSKWAGLAVRTGDYQFGPLLRFVPSRAAEWVAEEREAQARRERRTHEVERIGEPGLGLADAFWPEERLQVASGYVDRLLRAGDLQRASEVRYDTIPRIENWHMMKVVASTPNRRVLTDYEGTVWVAVPIEQASLSAEETDL